MMKKVKITIKAESPLLLGSGSGYGSLVDTDMIFDEMGMPFFPARRLKGLLRESAEEVIDMLGNDRFRGFIQCGVDDVFGCAGKRPLIMFHNLLLDGSREAIPVLRTARDEYSSLVTPAAVLECLSEIRQQTAIGNDGIAKPHSLRTIRVLRQYGVNSDGDPLPRVFSGEILLLDEGEDIRRLLSLAALNLRRAGSKRHRGLGEIECSVFDDKGSDLGQATLLALENYVEQDAGRRNHELSDTQGSAEYGSPVRLQQAAVSNKRHIMPYRICALSPLVFTGPGGDENIVRTLDYVPGSALAGFFAGEFLRKTGLDSAVAHQNDRFRDWFLDGALIFSNGYYCGCSPDDKEKLTQPVPLHLHTDKEQCQIFDLMNGAPKDDTRGLNGYYTEQGKGRLACTAPRLEVNFHLNRNAGVSGRQMENINENTIFNYESICAGQYFAGQICGAEDDIRAFASMFTASRTGADGTVAFEGRLGRSLGVQYGKAEIKLLPVEEASCSPLALGMGIGDYERDDGEEDDEDWADDNDINIPAAGNEIYLTFNSPVILLNQFGFPEASPKILAEYLERMLPGRFEIDNPCISGGELNRHYASEATGNSFARTDTRDSFLSHWKLRRPTARMLTAGSSCRITVAGGIDPAVEELALEWQQKGMGERCNEGYGQVQVKTASFPSGIESIAEWKSIRNENRVRLSPNIPPLAIEILYAVVENRWEQVLGYKAAQQASAFFKQNRNHPTNSLLGRLESIIQTCDNSMKLSQQMNKLKKPAREQLEGYNNVDKSLWKMLNDDSSAYLAEAWDSDDMKTAREMAARVGIELPFKNPRSFKLFWQVFLRTLRKLKQNKSGDPSNQKNGGE